MVFLGLGPEPDKVPEWFDLPEDETFFYLESPDFIGQVDGWLERVPANFVPMAPEEFTVAWSEPRPRGPLSSSTKGVPVLLRPADRPARPGGPFPAPDSNAPCGCPWTMTPCSWRSWPAPLWTRAGTGGPHRPRIPGQTPGNKPARLFATGRPGPVLLDQFPGPRPLRPGPGHPARGRGPRWPSGWWTTRSTC